MLVSYFPFTYIQKTIGIKINRIFSKFLIYQPVKNLTPIYSDEKTFDVLVPNVDYSDEVKLVTNEFYNFTSSNYGSKKIDIKLTESNFKGRPFYDDYSIESIRNKIKNFDLQETKECSQDILSSSYLFLTLAQYNDFYNHQFSLDIEKFRTKEKFLSKILQGHNVTKTYVGETHTFLRENNTSEFMCSERIKAWSTMVLDSKVFPEVLITDSSSVLEILKEIDFGVKPLKTDSVFAISSKNKEKFIGYLTNIITQNNLSHHKVETPEELVEKQEPININKKNDSIRISMFILPGLSIKNFLTKISSLKFKINGSKKKSNNCKNTVVIEIN